MTNSSKVGGGAKGAAAKDNIDVMVFENAEFGPVRTFTDKDGTPYFCGKDVCEALGFKRTSEAIQQHVSKVDTVKRRIYIQRKLKDGTLGVRRKMEMLFMNESGYRLETWRVGEVQA